MCEDRKIYEPLFFSFLLLGVCDLIDYIAVD